MRPRNALAEHRILASILIVAAALMGYAIGGEAVASGAPQDHGIVQQP